MLCRDMDLNECVFVLFEPMICVASGDGRVGYLWNHEKRGSHQENVQGGGVAL